MTVHPELRGDYHVHSTFSDDATATLAENIAAAHARGLTYLRLIDHVRIDTTWVPEFVAAVEAEPIPDGLTVLTGVEAKILNSAGDVDAPRTLAGIDTIVIADHQFPGPDGPWSPERARAELQGGLSVPDALDLLIAGLVGAMARTERSQLAHCFSILPKIGLSEDDLSDDQLTAWASAAASTGTLVELNEKWGAPGTRAVLAAIDAGVALVASTDSHVATDVGRYTRVATLLDEVRA